MSQNGKPQDNGSNLPPMVQNMPLKGIEAKLQSLSKQVKRIEERIEPVQQMELLPQPDLAQISQDLKGWKNLYEILQSLKTSLLGLQERLRQIDEWGQSLSEPPSASLPVQEAIQSQLQTLELLIQNFQDSLSLNKDLIARVSQLERQQAEMMRTFDQQLSQIQQDLPRLANRLSPMQMTLNGKQLSLKTLIGMFLFIALCQTIVGVPIMTMFLSRQQTPVLERINGRVNNLEINQKKLLNR